MRTAQQSTTELIANDDEEKHMSAQLHLILIGVLREKPLNTVMGRFRQSRARVAQIDEPLRTCDSKPWVSAGAVESDETNKRRVHSVPRDLVDSGGDVRVSEQGCAWRSHSNWHRGTTRVANTSAVERRTAGYVRGGTKESGRFHQEKSTLNGVVPMEVNWLDKGLKGKAKGKKGKGGKNDQGRGKAKVRPNQAGRRLMDSVATVTGMDHTERGCWWKNADNAEHVQETCPG